MRRDNSLNTLETKSTAMTSPLVLQLGVTTKNEEEVNVKRVQQNKGPYL